MKFTAEETTHRVTVWDENKKYGFRFDKGDKLAICRLTVITDRANLTTAEGMQELDAVRAEFLKYARASYPVEFGKQ